MVAAVILLSIAMIFPTTSANELDSENDDDSDGYPNEIEIECGSNTTDANDTPDDLDEDGVCNLMDPDMDVYNMKDS